MQCPSAHQLEELARTGATENLATIESHLSDCERCQRLLERFADLANKRSLWELEESSDRQDSAPAADELIGTELDGYLVLEKVGKGASGSVYRALQTVTDRVVAIKVMLARRFSEDHVTNWRRESRLAARIQHPGVVAILDAGSALGYEYCVFEWIDGGNLRDRLQNFQLDFREAARIALEIARGCAALHEKRILHRDITPTNVLLDREDCAKLADFGIARAIDETITATEGIGTPGFMSPEQLGFVPRELDERTDVYGIGAVIYTMLLGRGPFAGSSITEVVANAATHNILSPSSERSVPKPLETICLKCLEYDPRARYPSAEALAEDLERFLGGEPILAQPPSLLRRTHKWLRSNTRTVSAVALVAIGLICFTIGLALRSRQAQRQIARERLAQVFEVDPSGLSRALERFEDVHESHRDYALREVKNVDSVRSQLRQLLASDSSAGKLLDFAAQHASDLPVDEFAAVFRRLQQAPELPVSDISELPSELQATLNSDDSPISETQLAHFALVASAAPETISGANQRQIVKGLQGNGQLHLSVWTTGFSRLAKDLTHQILSDLSGGGTIGDETLLEYGFTFALADTSSEQAEALAAILLHCPVENLVEFINRLPETLKEDVARELNQFWQDSPLMDREAKLAKQEFPNELSDIRSQLEQYHAIFTEDVVLLPIVPLNDWPKLAERLNRSPWSLLEFRPATIGGNEIAAVTLAKSVADDTTNRESDTAMDEATSSSKLVVDEATSPQTKSVVDEATSPSKVVMDEATSPNLNRSVTSSPTNTSKKRAITTGQHLSLDVPESEVDTLCEQHALDGLYPISIWARPAVENDFDNLLVTIVWGRTPHPRHIRIDEWPSDWGINIRRVDRSNYLQANRFFLLEMGRRDDVEPGQVSMTVADVHNTRRDTALTTRRSVALLRDDTEQVERREEESRLQYLASTRVLSYDLTVSERNFKFRSRPRKLTLDTVDPQLHRSRAERLLQLGFLPESCSPAATKSGAIAISSRWSRDYSDLDNNRDEMLAAAVLGCFLLGDSRPIVEAFACQLDRTVASLVSSLGSSLQPRHAESIAQEFRQNQDSRVLYSLAMLVSYMPDSAITPELQRELEQLAATSTHAGVLSAVSKCTGVKFENSRQSNTLAKQQSVVDGKLDCQLPDHPMVQVVPKDQVSFLGGERLTLWESSAFQELAHISYRSFAISIKPVTFRQYHQYQRARNEELKPMPTTCRSVDCPAVEISYYEMLRYCRWLSEQAGIPESDIGLPPIEEIGPDMEVDRNLTRCKGYRLPTDYEWEMASRAGTYTDRFFGNADRLLQDYANTARSNHYSILPVGQLKPNPYGLLDIYGNSLEMSLLRRHGGPHLEIPEKHRHLKSTIPVAGGSFLTHGMYASARARLSVAEKFSADMHVGFRVARTLEF